MKRPEPRNRNQKENHFPPFPIVGIGASAGGLETFAQLLKGIPADTGMAFVFIQHLDPTHSSFLTKALNAATPMPVHEIRDGMAVAPDHVYVIPPGFDLDIAHGVLRLTPRSKEEGNWHLPIDSFFRSLAVNCEKWAIGIVLSGNATDGTEGLRAIQGGGGFTFAQEPSSAKFIGMPESAVNAGVVDFSLTIPQLSAELVRISQHLYYSGRSSDPFSDPRNEQDFKKIVDLLKSTAGIDFNEYKPATTKRRITRRMALLHIETLADYLNFLRKDAAEPRALCADILIHVTSFFRDPEAFKKLQKDIFPEIRKHKEGRPIRIWVAGCSSGEEVYSLAISLLESLGENSPRLSAQIFGSDISEKMIEKCRAGFYPESQMRNISPERIKRFFVKVEGGYRISRMVRDLCVFVHHDLARDPPFSKLDLITCRNVLIYFDQPLQKRILSTFHYCLNQPGFLLLGRAENVSGHQRLFSVEDKVNKIFSRTAVPSQLRFAMPREANSAAKQAVEKISAEAQPSATLVKVVEGVLLANYSPCGVVINERMEVIQFRGKTSLYLEHPPGEPETNLLKMAKEGLFVDLEMTIAKAKKEKKTARKENVRLKISGKEFHLCNIVVIPIAAPTSLGGRLFLVLFEEVKDPSPSKKSRLPVSRKLTKKEKQREELRSLELEKELEATKEYLQSVNLEQQDTNDALASANEELVSGNEELQSMNEELETAKEELQSTNEELTTVNDELQSRNQDVGLINTDLINLLDSVEIPIVILDLQHQIRRFTPHVRSIMNLLPSDVGRSIDDIKLNLKVENLGQQIDEVISSSEIKVSDVQNKEGIWYQLQVRPYKTLEGKVDGAILSLVDINTLKLAKAKAEEANRTKDLFLATLSHELRTPLTSLILQAQLMRRGDMDEAKVRRASEKIENAAKMQAQLIEDLLDISRIMTGKLSMDRKIVDISQVVRDALETVSPLAESGFIEMSASIEELDERVSGDPVRLQQVVWNLLTNAIKFSSKHSKVYVSLHAVDGQAQIQVEDHGIGIEPEFLPEIFKRFTQAEGSITRTHGGLGLGLAIVRHLVEMHGGTIRVDSLGKNTGSTFTVTLPLVKVRPAKSNPEKNTAKQKSSGPGLVKAIGVSRLRSRKILIVDDDSGTREALGELLAQTGADIRIAKSAEEGMRVLQEFRPEELICDLAMPGEDGYTFLRKVRKLDADSGGQTPALALTALASEADRQKAFAAGFQMHLSKPVDFDKLEDALVRLGEGSHRVH